MSKAMRTVELPLEMVVRLGLHWTRDEGRSEHQPDETDGYTHRRHLLATPLCAERGGDWKRELRSLRTHWGDVGGDHLTPQRRQLDRAHS